MQSLSLLFCGLFVLGAAVQWNDPDPLGWMAAYLVGAGLALAAALDHWWAWPKTIAAVLYLAAFLTLAPTIGSAPSEAFTSVQMQSLDHEEPREAVGLGLLTVWTSALAGAAWRRRGDGEDEAPV